MDKVKKPIRDIVRFLNMAAIWQQQQQNQKQSHLKYAISRVMPSCEAANRAHETELARVNIDHCTSDDKGNIMMDGQGNVVFTKDASRKRNTEHDALWDSEDEVGVYFAKVVPSDLTPAQERAFAGFVIPELSEPEGE